MNLELENFYSNWSAKAESLIVYDNESAVRKIDAIVAGMPILESMRFKTVIDFGCGYGKALENFSRRYGVEVAHGFDFSEHAIAYAKCAFESPQISYHSFSTLDINENINMMKAVLCGVKADCILLIDLLEHVPDCVQLLTRLSEITNYFLIKLPIEEVLLNNYILRKTYPSTMQSNGHLREFTVNSVYYFIRRLGLTPLAEGVHIYDFRDSFPPQPNGVTFKSRVKRIILKFGLVIISKIIPARIYIRIFGPGSYYCLATFSADHILRP